MMVMKAQELRKKFIEFFEKRGHKVIPSASLVPENDPSVLFTTAGMHPLVPYLLGEFHPEGKRLVNIQKCIRTDDIEEVGDPVHNTFFEMLGYWSMGDYFKRDSIKYTYEFYTKVLGFDKDKISVTVFKGDEDALFDEESYNTWKDEIGIPEDRIYKYGRKENWWGPVGATGPCGPDTEMFIDTGIEKCSNGCEPNCNCGKYVEIGNNVFMEYNKTVDGKIEALKQKNVDVGLGFERLLMFTENKNDVYQTELFEPLIKKIEELSEKRYDTQNCHSGLDPESIQLKKSILDSRFRGNDIEVDDNRVAFRIIADHFRASVFAISDGALPSNKDRGYIVRRLLRRAIRYGKILGIEKFLSKLYDPLCHSGLDPKTAEILKQVQDDITKILDEEEEKFHRALLQLDIISRISSGRKGEDMKKMILTGGKAFEIYQDSGVPIENLRDEAEKRKIPLSKNFDIEFQSALARHQELSRKGAEKKFKGGLADNKEQTTKLHTAAHLLLASLRQILSKDVEQKGANITEQRLRFDFNWPEKLNDEQIKKVEDLVNSAIDQKLDVKMEEMSLEDAKKYGAHGTFLDRYGDKVKVYTIGPSTDARDKLSRDVIPAEAGIPAYRTGRQDRNQAFFSKEICGGPHVKNTSELGHFKIIKEESSSSGIRRIKAVLE